MKFGYRRKERKKQRAALRIEALEERRLLATLVVTSSDDSGPGSLRQAIEVANELPGHDQIHFALPAGNATLRPQTALPRISDRLSIDGTTQPNYAGRPVVELRGDLLPDGLLPDGSVGLDLAAGQSSIVGLAITGFSTAGVRISEGGDNTLLQNFVGLNTAGDAAIPNGVAGILIQNSANNRIGGVDESDRNIISGNLADGIVITGAGATGNVIQGNFIGTDPSGEMAIANGAAGVLVTGNAQENIVGTQNGQFAGNLISGNGQNGVHLSAALDSVVAGNLIGLNRSGNRAIPNGERGIGVGGGSQRNRIGTDDNGVADTNERNVISGNVDQGVTITGVGTDYNWVAGNYIGTDITGMHAIPNTSTGVQITAFARFNSVGTTGDSKADSAAGNLISGNQVFGIRFRNNAKDNSAAGNWIGVDATGLAALPNGAAGIGTFQAATFNRIGGPASQQRNVISGNSSWGIDIQTASGSNQILGNWIGVATDGLTPLGNGTGGIRIDSAADNRIGGLAAGQANTIAHNGPVGVVITGNSSISNFISGNSIFAQDIGIDLDADGSTPNDADDSDIGANGLQNFPLIQYVASEQDRTEVAGTLHSLADSEFMLELFANPAGSAVGQGQRSLGAAIVQTNAQGYGSWRFNTDALVAGEVITAIAHNPLLSTSEFSAAVEAGPRIRLTTWGSDFIEGAGELIVTVYRDNLPQHGDVSIALSGIPSQQAAIPTHVIIPDGESYARFSVQITDDALKERDEWFHLFAAADNGAGGALQLGIIDDDTGAWHNADFVEDINGDDIVSALDVLLIVNFLNSGANPRVQGSLPRQPREYLDTNNDGLISAVDALLVVNYLNAPRMGEGEAGQPDELIMQLAPPMSIDLDTFGFPAKKKKR